MAVCFDAAAEILPDRLQRETRRMPPQTKRAVTEIRLRTDAPLLLTTADEPLFLRSGGHCSAFAGSDVLSVTASEVQETFLRACRWSVHSFEAQIRDGFLTLPGGHRLGLCGMTDAATGALTHVTSMNLRVARQAPAAAKTLCDTLFSWQDPRSAARRRCCAIWRGVCPRETAVAITVSALSTHGRSSRFCRTVTC